MADGLAELAARPEFRRVPPRLFDLCQLLEVPPAEAEACLWQFVDQGACNLRGHQFGAAPLVPGEAEEEAEQEAPEKLGANIEEAVLDNEGNRGESWI